MLNNIFDLTGKNILITGAAGVLGKSFVKSFLEFNANVIMVDLDQDQLDILVNEFAVKEGQRIIGLACDITKEDAVVNLIKKVESDFGEIHVLHNNAASKSSDLKKFFADFEDFSFEIWREVMSVNIDAMFLMAKHVGKHMVTKNIKGSIIQTASIYGVVAPDQSIYDGSNYLGGKINTPAVYSASKAGVIGLTQYLSTYWGSKGIRVNTITPGGIQSGQNDIFLEKYSKKVPLGRMGQADELAGALIFLASDASSYVTGQNIIVDGGFTVW
jgi:NAD(P)-dependent dehydrogenase (short-subunit alcohol dehydrogenase family)